VRTLNVHQVDITHYRLIDLARFADQAEPFYRWIERKARQIVGAYRSLSEILLDAPKALIVDLVNACYTDSSDAKPLLFDGIGRVYPHTKACFYFFAWMMRDAPQQRLAPLISRMQRLDNVSKLTAEVDTLAELIFEYRSVVRSFEWSAVREVVIDRLEGSRRSISGHRYEPYVRASLIAALQYYYSVHGDYGKYQRVEIAAKQLKIGSHTIDVAAELIPKSGGESLQLLIPVKTRETEGGGHSHLFTRDIITAISTLGAQVQSRRVVVVIIASNWSASEIETISSHIDMIFHFDMAPNQFFGFDEDAQIRMNRFVESILGDTNVNHI